MRNELLAAVSILLLCLGTGCDVWKPPVPKAATARWVVVPALPRGAVIPPPPDVRDEDYQRIVKLIQAEKDDEVIEEFESHPLWNKYSHTHEGSLLLAATKFGRVRVAEYLLDHGAPLNEDAYIGGNALRRCVEFAGHCRMRKYGGQEYDLLPAFDLLLHRGASIKFANRAGGLGVRFLERGGAIWPTDDLVSMGTKYQMNRKFHAIQRSVMIGLIRDLQGLPVDAMLPLNAPALYLEHGRVAGVTPQAISEAQ